MKKLLFALALSVSAVLSAAGFKGPFSAEGLVFYFVHNGGPLKVTMEAIPGKQGPVSKALVSFYDVNEKKISWNYEILKPGTPTVFSNDYGADAPKGLYEVRTALLNACINVKTEPDVKFGIMPVRSTLRPVSVDQFKTAYLYVSANDKPEFTLKNRYCNWELFGADGKSIAKNKAYHSSAVKIDVKPLKDTVICLKTDVRKNAPASISADHSPFILCPDAETAKTIAGGYFKAKDGSIFPSAYQAAIHDWMKTLTPADLEVKYVPLMEKKAEWEKEPGGPALLFSSLRHVKVLLDRQIIDPSDPAFGIVPGKNYVTLALAAGLNRPVNPYYNNRAMKNRAMLGLFRRYLRFGQNGTELDCDNGYAGLDAFEGHKMSQCVYFMRDVLTPEEKALLAEGICRTVDRFAFFHASAENQSSHWLMTYQNLADSGLPLADYKRLAKDYLSSLDDPKLNPFMKTGYQEESYGPDATYQGLGACFQAIYYRRTGNPEAKEGLRTIYNLYNHSVAPEPDGKIYGCGGFSPRTQGTWVHRQWGAGTRMMAGELPEAACWHRDEKKEGTPNWNKLLKENSSEFYDRKPQWLIFPSEAWTGLYYGYFHLCSVMPDAKFPVEQSDSFTKNFNNEFQAVRKPAYYVFSYTGTTRHAWTRRHVRKDPTARNWKDSWNVVQGLELIWSPEYGTLMASHCWNAFTQSMISATLNDDKIAIPDYWTLKFSFDGKKLELFNRLFDQPVTMERKVFYEEKQIRQELTVAVEKDWSCKALYEQFPILVKKDMNLTINGSEVKIVNAAGKGFLLKFSGDFKTIETVEKQRHMGYELLPLRIQFGNEFKAGQKLHLTCTIEPI